MPNPLCDLFPPEFRYQCDPYCAAGCGPVPGVHGHGHPTEAHPLRGAGATHWGSVHVPLEYEEDPDKRPYIWEF